MLVVNDQGRRHMTTSKLLLSAAGLVLCVLAQNPCPALADNAAAPRPVAHSQSGATAKTCYPVWGQCTKDSDCCTGFCRVGRVYAYCDYGK
jgi:hypothetical protein